MLVEECWNQDEQECRSNREYSEQVWIQTDERGDGEERKGMRGLFP